MPIKKKLTDIRSRILRENIDEKVIGLIGDKYQTPTGFNPPFVDFLMMQIDNKTVFLKFKGVIKSNKHYIHTYLANDIKIVLDYDSFPTSSGNGSGGKLKLFINGKLIETQIFWASN